MILAGAVFIITFVVAVAIAIYGYGYIYGCKCLCLITSTIDLMLSSALCSLHNTSSESSASRCGVTLTFNDVELVVSSGKSSLNYFHPLLTLEVMFASITPPASNMSVQSLHHLPTSSVHY